MAESSFVVVSDLFPQLIATMPLAIDRIIRKAAFDIQARAMIAAPHDTGFLRSSIYTKTSKDTTYGVGLVADGPLLPETDTSTPLGVAVVAVGAEYGIYQEMGTRYMPAHPFLVPAADAEKPELEAALAIFEAYWMSEI